MVLKIGLCITFACFHALISIDAAKIGIYDASVEARFKEMEKHLLEQSFQLKNQKKRIELLEKSANHYNVDIDRCEHRVQRLNELITKLENTEAKNSEDINDLHKNLSMVYNHLSKCKSFLNNKQLTKTANNRQFTCNSKSDMKIGAKLSGNEKGQTKQNIPAQESKVKIPLRRNPNEAKAFCAHLSHYEYRPTNSKIIIFDTETEDTHDTYNKYSGTYIAPQDGLYGFVYTIRMGCTSSGASGSFELIRNDNVQSVIYIGETGCEHQETTNGFAIVQARKGDTFYVRTHSSFYMHGHVLSDHNGWTSFCGWLIR
ncbi:uncharacterized protein [Mytilus edulis]|uniref:uncharacterized protein n=1 Tax=Mytilus edulis TaxID=6550 RepID=UPI0039F0800F